MSKNLRNKLCPCGSGKKYKKCCGTNQTLKIDANMINHELYELHESFIDETTIKHGQLIEETLQTYHQSAFDEYDEMQQIYQNGLLIWLFTNPVHSLLKDFITNKKYKLHKKSLLLADKWKNVSPTVVEIVALSTGNQQFIQVRSLITGDRYIIPVQNKKGYVVGSLLLGSIIPFASHHNFLFSMIKLYNHAKADVLELIYHSQKRDGQISAHFPSFYSDLLKLGINDDGEQRNLYHEVSQLFANHMTDKNISDDLILKGLKAWENYCRSEEPTFKKIDSYAAAVEYFTLKLSSNQHGVTQNQLAKEYGISPGSVSANYRKLENALNQEKPSST
ncbi:SEC-C domain-containing protein [Oceanobacillus damuensis]|uniref:SEC-C domain-containing protein n=1 Tax=Oceanobacillus damuensis TaxID=937928 RepID=UPI0008298729|nr:SEC-C domain-containing protein [Oceanobacillus damuensis]